MSLLIEWKRIPGVDGGSCGARWLLGDTGWFVQHCGHPTANWPYYGVSPHGAGMLTMPNGRGFQHLKDAQDAVVKAAELEYGEFILANDKPRPKPAKWQNSDARQRVLFAGLDCLPGQQDLFPTDGGADEPHRDDQDRSA